MKNELLKIIFLLILFLSNLIFEDSIIINTLSFIFFMYFVYILYKVNTEIFLGYLFINIGLTFMVFSAYMIDIYPNVYLYEINKYTQTSNITSILSFYIYSMMSFLNKYKFKLPKIKKVYYSDSEVKIFSKALNLFSISIFLLFIYMFYLYGLPILTAYNRVFFINSLPVEWLKMYVFLSLISLYSGYMYYKSSKRMYIVFFIIIIFIRILSMQKFTELVIDASLFFTFYIFKSKKNVRSINKAVIFFLMALIPLILMTYEGNTDVFKGRLMAQSQLAYYLNKEYGGFDTRFDEALNLEFNNFTGSEPERMKLFEEGKFYGLFKLMELSNTGRNLMLQAEEKTSSSGSVPIIYIYYFGYFFGYIVLMSTLFVLKFMFDFFVINIVKTNNLVVLFLVGLIFIRIYKFFIIGSPSYLYNFQFFFYGLLALIFMKIKIINIKAKHI